MKTKATTCLQGVEMIDGAGHWIQQEQPIRLSERLLDFIEGTGRTQ
jgi:pimeloyl-ACP methyl ester carboxylesterase